PVEPPLPTECTWQGESRNYYFRSTVLGGEIIDDGEYRYVWAGEQKIAYLTYRMSGIWPNSTRVDAVNFHHSDALGTSQRVTRPSPEDLFGVPLWNPDYIDQRQTELSPEGGNVGTVTDHRVRYGTPVIGMFPLEL